MAIIAMYLVEMYVMLPSVLICGKCEARAVLTLPWE
jgi:hypothetical protein